MAIINVIDKGTYAPYNGMTMKRKYDAEIGFKTRFITNEDNTALDFANNIMVPYIEYFVNSEDEIVPELTRKKHYLVINHVGAEMANLWFISLARTPIATTIGIMDSIEATLAALPQDIPNGYVLPIPQ